MIGLAGVGLVFALIGLANLAFFAIDISSASSSARPFFADRACCTIAVYATGTTLAGSAQTKFAIFAVVVRLASITAFVVATELATCASSIFAAAIFALSSQANLAVFASIIRFAFCRWRFGIIWYTHAIATTARRLEIFAVAIDSTTWTTCALVTILSSRTVTSALACTGGRRSWRLGRQTLVPSIIPFATGVSGRTLLGTKTVIARTSITTITIIWTVISTYLVIMRPVVIVT